MAGLNFRINQLFLLIPILGSFFDLSLTGRKIKFPLGFFWLVLWTIFILLFTPNTTFLLNSLGYSFWLLFNLALIFSSVQLFGTMEKLIKLIKWYLYSFFLIAIFGIIQFFCPILHLGAPLIGQWWFPGVIPRINGFSYEASFFATYMLMGWILCGYLIKTKTTLFNPNLLKIIFLTLTLVMILSSSRIGILMMIMWFMQYPILCLFQLKKLKINKTYFRYSLSLLIFFLITSSVIFFLIGPENLLFLLGGTGLGNTASHSVVERTSGALDVWEIFLRSPLVGYSLGGIPSAIGQMKGVIVSTVEMCKENQGNVVFLEVLAASGIIGFIPFVVYIASLIIHPLKLAKQTLNKDYRNLLTGMVLALVFEFIILQANQNILRPYVWFHISILSALYTAILRTPKLNGDFRIEV